MDGRLVRWSVGRSDGLLVGRTDGRMEVLTISPSLFKKRVEITMLMIRYVTTFQHYLNHIKMMQGNEMLCAMKHHTVMT